MSENHVSLAPDDLEATLSTLIVKTLVMNVDPDSDDVEAPLGADGLGLDSIDMLAVALTVSQTYGVKLRADEMDVAAISGSIRSLATYIAKNRS